jgi:hypothetical protein
MYYVCIEENQVVGVMNYEPSVPLTVSVVRISDEMYGNLAAGSHYFDTSDNTIKSVPSSQTALKSQESKNIIERNFLSQTDWKVLRHLRQKTLGIPTTLTEDQYLELEQQRHAAASRIVE